MDISNLTFTHQVSISPSDSVTFTTPVYVMVTGVAGNVKVETKGGEVQIWPLALKEVLPIQVVKVYATDTTATGITILYN
jgi:hypothetical protein